MLPSHTVQPNDVRTSSFNRSIKPSALWVLSITIELTSTQSSHHIIHHSIFLRLFAAVTEYSTRQTSNITFIPNWPLTFSCCCCRLWLLLKLCKIDLFAWGEGERIVWQGPSLDTVTKKIMKFTKLSSIEFVWNFPTVHQLHLCMLVACRVVTLEEAEGFAMPVSITNDWPM